MLIVGAGGLALQILDDLEDLYNDKIVFWSNRDVNEQGTIAKKYKIIKTDAEVCEYFEQESKQFILAVGGCLNRRRLFEKFTSLSGAVCSFISPECRISRYASLENGVLVLAQANVESDVSLGIGTLVNVNAVISHECKVGVFCEFAPGAVLGGNIKIGNDVFIGLNATILPNLSIGNHTIVGAGATVTKSFSDNLLIKGNPGRAYERT